MGKMSRNVMVLGWVSFFNDAASEMLYPVMPLFLAGALGASPAVLGLVDGMAEGLGSALRWVGGVMSDRMGKRKVFVGAGYGLSVVSKPVMGAAGWVGGWPLFMVGRCADRLGKSVRNAARDALLAASVGAEGRGRAFGFQRAMDTAGAVVGPLVTLLAMMAFVGGREVFAAAWKGGGSGGGAMGALPFRWMFFIALVPGVLTVLMVGAVKEIAPKAGEATKTGGKAPAFFQSYPAGFWRLLLAAFVFSLGNSSDTFLILRSSQMGMTFGWIIVLYAAYNVVYAGASTPMGGLSDKVGRKPVLMGGWLVYAGVYAGFAGASAAWSPWVLLLVYGLYAAMTDGVTGALISDLIPDGRRAGAIGLYYTAVGLGTLCASVTAGALWEVTVGGMRVAFLLGAVCAVVAVGVLSTVRVGRREE